MPKPNAVITESSPSSLAEARATLTRLQTEAVELRRVATGTTSVETVRREVHGIINQQGRAETVEIDAPHTETRAISTLERLQATRRLDELALEIARAEEAVEIARMAAAVADRQARDALVAEGVALVRRELPELVRRQRQLQREWQAFLGGARRSISGSGSRASLRPRGPSSWRRARSSTPSSRPAARRISSTWTERHGPGAARRRGTHCTGRPRGEEPDGAGRRRSSRRRPGRPGAWSSQRPRVLTDPARR